MVNDQGQPSDISTVKRIVADLTGLYGLMRKVDLRADCFVLNPPWDLHQYRKSLAELAESDLPAVRAAFAAHDGRTGTDSVDSTVASLCLALDRSSDYGEGFLIGNESTLQRLIFGPGAPHAALAVHIWSHLVITGNICGPVVRGPVVSDFRTGVIYFARSHDAGPPMAESTLYQPPLITSLEQAQSICAELHQHRLELRFGAEIKSYAHTEDTVDKWQAVGGEWERLARKDKPQWNLSLRADDTIKTDLSLFDTHSARVSKQEAESLFSLEGKHPMQLVMQRQQRLHLERAAFGPTWRVDPKLQAAIKLAVKEYHAVRAPLYPLSPIQRLGYLDEVDDIVCSKDLMVAGRKAFRADHTYPLRSSTVAVKRSGTKLNLAGELDQVEWDGQELAFFITDGLGQERVFMEARLRASNVRVSLLKPGEKPGRQDEDHLEPCQIDFTLHELVEHFVIPDVPDVARVNPDGYQRNLHLLKEIEELCV
jgi:hypothetical protein